MNQVSDFKKRITLSSEMNDETYFSVVKLLFQHLFSLASGPFISILVLLEIQYLDKNFYINSLVLLISIIFVIRVSLHLSFNKNQKEIQKDRNLVIKYDLLFQFFACIFSIIVSYFSVYILLHIKNPEAHSLVLIFSIGYTSAICARNAGRNVFIGAQVLITCIPIIICQMINENISANFIGVMLITYYVMLVSIVVALSKAHLNNAISNLELFKIAHTDFLTGLPNRLSFQKDLDKKYKEKTEYTIVMIDLDDFKDVNDSLGHDIGDKVIQEAALRIQNNLREKDVVYRVGGDEFIILLNEISNSSSYKCVERICNVMQTPMILNNHKIELSASFGIAEVITKTEKEEALKAADIALYSAKLNGKNSICVFNEKMKIKNHRKNNILKELRSSLNDSSIEMHYQPIVELKTGEINCFEALMRWKSPTFGFVSPGEFIPLAEEYQLIEPLTAISIQKSLEALKSWPENINVAINFSATLFYNIDKIERYLIESIAKLGIKSSRIEIEITETAILKKPNIVVNFVKRMKEIGIKVNLDDFGVGQTSLSYLQTIEFSKIKIDKAFTDNMTTDKRSLAIIESIAILCKKIDMNIVVEGVETDQQMMMLKDCEVSHAQGYLISKPVAEIFVQSLIENYNRPVKEIQIENKEMALS